MRERILFLSSVFIGIFKNCKTSSGKGGVRGESNFHPNVKACGRHWGGVWGLLSPASGNMQVHAPGTFQASEGGWGWVRDPFEGWDLGALRGDPLRDSGRGVQRMAGLTASRAGEPPAGKGSRWWEAWGQGSAESGPDRRGPFARRAPVSCMLSQGSPVTRAAYSCPAQSPYCGPSPTWTAEGPTDQWTDTGCRDLYGRLSRNDTN